MHIVFHAHRADVPEALRQRADAAIRKLAARLRRAVAASVRFAVDGPTRRVEIVLRAPRQEPLFAVGSGRLFETALGEALTRLESHLAHLKEARGRRIRSARAASGRVLAAAKAGAPTSPDDGDATDKAADA